MFAVLVSEGADIPDPALSFVPDVPALELDPGGFSRFAILVPPPTFADRPGLDETLAEKDECGTIGLMFLLFTAVEFGGGPQSKG